jgi:iron complex outermembrane recepter protein
MIRVLKCATLAGVAAGPLLCQALASNAVAQAPPGQFASEVIIVTGTRVADRSALDTAVAVDVVDSEALEQGGVAEVNQALSVNLPSFNFPRPALRDGTDTVRPAALRGLAPDQTLVLLNSKRRHLASLVNVNESIGRGASAADLNTIPIGAVSAVEVLRDGASAQYGSDAIAGVINVRLREASSGGAFAATYGYRDTTYDVPVTPAVAGLPITAPAIFSRDREDGETSIFGGWIGLPLIDENGFVTVSAEYKQQSHTERSGFDTRQQYVLLAGGAFDPREATINRFNAWTGEPELEQSTIFVNAGYDISEGVELYGWAGYQDRQALSAGFFRRALDERNVVEIYPDGFLPKINPTVTDYSAAGGVRFALAGWDMDASLVYGDNKMDFVIRDTLNRSIGPTSKTVFDAGGFEYDQLVFNVSAVRQVEVGLASPLNVAAGVEARKEGYRIFAGESDSFRNGGVLLALGAIGCLTPTPAQVAAGGCATASGAQVFPGFRPENEIDTDRDSIGVFVDLEANVTEALLVSVAVRYEDYSDFGDSATGKISARYNFSDMFALRASAQTGFRAPSLQQQFFATTSTNFIGGIPFDITTFRVSDPVAIALGAQPLDAEDSVSYSLGGVFRAGDFSLTVDGYRIDIDNRIVLSENLTQDNVRAFLQQQGFAGVGGGRFFINGVNTQTKGVDLVANYAFPQTAFGQFEATLGANFTETDVTRIPAIPVLSALTPAPPLFGRINVLTFEEGSPSDKYTLSLDWRMGSLSAAARAVRYGEVLFPNANPALDATLSPKTVVDLEGSWAVTDAVKLSIGADNVFDEYPDALPINLNTTSNTPYSAYSPFGYSGRFIYARAGLAF